MTKHPPPQEDKVRQRSGNTIHLIGESKPALKASIPSLALYMDLSRGHGHNTKAA